MKKHVLTLMLITVLLTLFPIAPDLQVHVARAANPDPIHIIRPDGSAAQAGDSVMWVYPMNFSSTPATGSITCPPGARIQNGSTITLKNSNANVFTYTFYQTSFPSPPSGAILVTPSMSAAAVAQVLAAQLTPVLVNGSWAGPRVTFTVSGATLNLQQSRSGTASNNPITLNALAQSSGFVAIGFAGGVTDDRVNLQWASDNLAAAGTILLKATDPAGTPTAFDLGTFNFFLYTPPAYASRAQPDINNHRIFIDKAMTVQGETIADGHHTTVWHGFMTLAIGYNAPPLPTGPDGSAITIAGVHFVDPGWTPIVSQATAVPLVVTGNTVSNHLAARFADTDKPGWNASLSNNWGTPEDGAHLAMLRYDTVAQTYSDVSSQYSKADRLAAFLAATQFLVYDVRDTIPDGSGQPAPYAGSWMAHGVLLGNGNGPVFPGLAVPVTIRGNDIDENGAFPADQFTPVWHADFGLEVGGHTANPALGSTTRILENTVRNVSNLGIFVGDDTGTVTIQGNTIELGPAGSYASPQGLLPPRTSARAIAALYNFENVYAAPPGSSLYPPVGGTVSIAKNTVVNHAPGSKDAGGILVAGDHASFFSAVTIADNLIELRDGTYGIRLTTTDVPGVSGPVVQQNTVQGSGAAGLLVGYPFDEPRDTVNTLVIGLDLRRFAATSAGTSFPDGPAAYVSLGSDAHNNTGTQICVPWDTPYSTFIHDLGTDNDFQPSCSPLAMTEYLLEKVRQMILPEGIAESLAAKLTNTAASLSAPNADRRQDAAGKLQAFIKECQAQSGKKLTVKQVQQLVAYAQEIIGTLSATQ